MPKSTVYEVQDGKGYKATDIIVVRRGDNAWRTVLARAEDLPLAPWRIVMLLNSARAIGYEEAMEDLRNLIGAEKRI